MIEVVPGIIVVGPALDALATVLGKRFSTAEGIRSQYARGESYPQAFPPAGVAFPETIDEVSHVVAICARYGLPMIPSGAGTSLEGHITAPHGGIAINLARMNRILAVNDSDLDCLVEAGVTREQLNRNLHDRGLFFPVDPGANATIGGMTSTRASGTNAVRYGTMMHNVLGLTVVRPDGTVIHTGGRARKSSAGYDLTRFYVGSEGTLGIIAEIRLRLYGVPETTISAVCCFEDLVGAVETATQLIQLGVPVARMEFLDEVQIRACNSYSRLSLREKPYLFFEFHGSKASAIEQAETAAMIAANNGGTDFEWAATTEERNRLWKARHNAYFAAVALRPGATIWSSDVCVPVSRLTEAVLMVRQEIDRNGLIASIVGHVGDGNFHVLFSLDPSDPVERERAEVVYHQMVEHAIRCGGTSTGEHGVGLVKRKHLVDEHGAEAVATMRALKHALDPSGLMNPGKIFI